MMAPMRTASGCSNTALLAALALSMTGACQRVGSTGHAGPTSQPPGTPSAGDCDLSTDDAVKDRVDEVLHVKLDPQYPCIQRATAFPKLVQVGSFAYDRGCAYDHVLYGCLTDDPGIPKRAMADAGWAGADAKKKERMALDWLEQVDLAGDGGLIESEPDPETDGFKKMGKTFSAPAFTHAADGGLTVTYWVARSGGMLPQTPYELDQTTFAADGTISGGKQLDAFTWNMEAH
jgi:hypothetical protein